MSELWLFLVASQVVIVFACRETSEPVLVDVETQGIDRGDGHVDAQVELEAVEEQGVVDVLTHYMGGALLRDLCELVRNYDTLALRGGCWFGYPKFIFVFFHFCF